MASGRRSEIRDQGSEVRGQRSEVRGQGSGVRGQRSAARDREEVWSPIPEFLLISAPAGRRDSPPLKGPDINPLTQENRCQIKDFSYPELA